MRDAGLQWDADRSTYAEVLGAVIGIDAAAIARGLFVKLDGVHGLFGAFFRRAGSGGFTVQAAMLLLAHSVGRMGYLQRCLPPAALLEVAQRWDELMVDTAQRVLDLAAHELTESVTEALQRPRRLGGFGLSSAVLLSPFAFIASVAVSAAQPGGHPLSVDTLPAESLLRQWLHAALTSPTVSALPLPSDTLHLSTANCVHLDADTFTGHYHAYPDQAAGLQSNLMTAATHSLYNARLSEVKRAGDLRGQARLCGGRASYASRWKTVRPTEEAYQLADEYYRYAARRDLGLPPTRDVTLPRQCAACGVSTAEDGRHGQRCIYNSSYTKLRHDSIEMLLHDAVRDGVGQAQRQQRGLPAAGRTVPDLLIHMNGKVFLCDVTVADTLANSNLTTAASGPARLAEEAARGKVDKYELAADAMRAVHLPFAVETMGGLSESAQQLIREIHYSAGNHNTWRDAAIIGTHLVDAVAIAVQRCTGMALQRSQWREREVAMGAEAA